MNYWYSKHKYPQTAEGANWIKFNKLKYKIDALRKISFIREVKIY